MRISISVNNMKCMKINLCIKQTKIRSFTTIYIICSPYFMFVLRENLMTHLHPNVEWMAARGIAHLDS